MTQGSKQTQESRQMEVVNHTRETLFRAMIGKNLTDWDLCLPIFEFTYNRPTHSSTSKSPFEVVYGFNPSLPMDLIAKPIAREESLSGGVISTNPEDTSEDS